MPYESVVALNLTIHSSIPHRIRRVAAINELSPAIENLEVFDYGDAGSDWAEFIIQSVVVGSEGSWHEDHWFCCEDFDENLIARLASRLVKGCDRVQQSFRGKIEYCNGIGQY